jgi:hypothetical protein
MPSHKFNVGESVILVASIRRNVSPQSVGMCRAGSTK